MRTLIVVLLILTIFLSACSIPTTPDEIEKTDKCTSLEGNAKDECYFEITKCSKIENSDLRDNCVVKLATIKEDLAVCELIINEKTQWFCHEEVAVAINNHDICKQIEDNYWADICDFKIAINNNDSTYCSIVSRNDKKMECYKEIALATNDVMLCEVLEESEVNRCKMTIAKQTLDPEVCETFESGLNQDICKLKIAKLSNNQLLCEEIGIDMIKEDCLKEFD